MSCTQSDHDALRRDVHLFFERTTMLPLVPFSVGGLIYRNCFCGSTLTLPECKFCGCACPSGDALPVGDEYAHARCAMLRAVERGKMKVSGWVEVRT